MPFPHHHAGVMLYGNGWWGVLEINYGVAVFHLISAALGPEFWELRPLAGTTGLTVAGIDGKTRLIIVLLVAHSSSSGTSA